MLTPIYWYIGGRCLDFLSSTMFVGVEPLFAAKSESLTSLFFSPSTLVSGCGEPEGIQVEKTDD